MPRKTGDWHKIRRRKTSRWQPHKPKKIKGIIGWDTETVKGKAWLVANSEGKYIIPSSGEEILEFLTQNKYTKTLNFWWNIDYDFRAIIKWLPKEKWETLRILHKCSYQGYQIRWIPKSYFSIKRSNRTAKFYDAFRFYMSSLESAASKYLGKHKLEMDREKLDDAKFVEEHKDEIIRYCIQDCKLTQELAEYLYNLFTKIGLHFDRPYSPAYLAYQKALEELPRAPYVSNRIERAAFYAYHGGRFEAFIRGFFDEITVIDINSAYPYALSKCPAFWDGEWIISRKPPDDAQWGLVNATVTIKHPHHSVLPFEHKGLLLFPRVEKRRVWMTLEEYRYIEHNDRYEVTPHKSYTFYPDSDYRPFAYLEKLYYERQKLKREGNDLQLALKIILNSTYGKLIQLTEELVKVRSEMCAEYTYVVTDPDYFGTYIKRYRAGTMFSPIYASYTTAIPRLMLQHMIDKYEDSVIFVATDSVALSEKAHFNDDYLGGWKTEIRGWGFVIGSGVYYISDDKKVKQAYRGFRLPPDISLYDLVMQHKDKAVIELEQKLVVSLAQALLWVNKLRPEDMNTFINIMKKLSVNFDRKRKWEREFSSFDDLLHYQIHSQTVII